MAFFRKIFDERAARFPDVARRPPLHRRDRARPGAQAVGRSTCIVTENMFGDILSDQTAALVGGMGMAPSGDIGDDHGAVPAVPRLGARHRRPGQGEPDGDDPVGGDDARLARRAAAATTRSRAAARRLERAVDERLRVGPRASVRVRRPRRHARDRRGDGRRSSDAHGDAARRRHRRRLLQPVPSRRAGARSRTWSSWRWCDRDRAKAQATPSVHALRATFTDAQRHARRRRGPISWTS